MDRQTIITIVDSTFQIAALLVVLLSARSVFSAIKNRYVFINGKKATLANEALGYWLVLLSWVVVAGVFSGVFVSRL